MSEPFPIADLNEISSTDLTPDKLEKYIPIPPITSLTKTDHKVYFKESNRPLYKYEKEYDQFCRWAAMPKDLRTPKTELEWERQRFMPKRQTVKFKEREDFRTKMLKYFWDWMMDIYPDVVYSVYQRAIGKKGSDKAASIFIDLLSKKMNLDKPKLQVQPMVLMGVPQEKIDQLFVPKGYENLIPDK